MEINNKTCESCTNYNMQQESKMFGHPCNIHGTANSYECQDYSKDPNTMEWFVYWHDFNRKKLTTYNVFDHYYFKKEVIQLRAKNPTKEVFSRELGGIVRYYFWSKTEWEIILSPWCGKADDVKIDVYDQLHMNWDAFVDYVYERSQLCCLYHIEIN